MRWVYAIVLSMLLNACAEDIGVPEASAANAKLAGVWEVTAGDLFSSTSGGALQYLELNIDGTGAIYRRFATTNIIRCRDIDYAVVSSSVVLISDFGLFQYQSSGSTLQLSDVNTTMASFASATEVPSSSRCKSFSNVMEVGLVQPAPREGTEIAYDGSVFWYSGITEDFFIVKIFSFDPMTQSVTDELDWTFAAPSVGAFQGPNVWSYGGDEASLRSLANMEVDRVRFGFGSSFDDDYSPNALAWDGTHLWVHARDFNNDTRELLQVDTSADPKMIVSAMPFDARVISLAFDGTDLWALLDFPPAVVRLDAEAARATETYEFPEVEGNINWRGIEFAGTDLFFLGDSGRTSPSSALFVKATP